MSSQRTGGFALILVGVLFLGGGYLGLNFSIASIPCPSTISYTTTASSSGNMVLLSASAAFSLFQQYGAQAGFSPVYWSAWQSGNYQGLPAVYDASPDSFDNVNSIGVFGVSWGPFNYLPHRYISIGGWTYTSTGTCYEASAILTTTAMTASSTTLTTTTTTSTTTAIPALIPNPKYSPPPFPVISGVGVVFLLAGGVLVARSKEAEP